MILSVSTSAIVMLKIKNIIFALEISKDKKVPDLESEVRKKLGANRNDFLRQIYPEE